MEVDHLVCILMLKANNKILKAAYGQNYENDLEIKSLLKGF